MTSHVTLSPRVRSIVRQAALVVALVALSTPACVPETWALERSWITATSLKDSRVHMLGDLGGELYFVSDSQLWKTNGTRAGTVLVTTAASPLEIFFTNFCPVAVKVPATAEEANGVLFLSADDGVHGHELWKTDGTAPGTSLVKDIRPSGASFPSGFVSVPGAVHFRARNNQTCCEIWRSDGTDAGTVLLDQPLPLGSLDGFYVFERNGALWRSDGTAPGTVMIRVINPSGSSFPQALATHDGKLYFTAQPGPQLWVTDGTIAGTEALFDTRSGDAVMTCGANGVCYFVEGAPSGTHAWRTNGTPAETTKLAEIETSVQNNLVVADGTAYFTADRQLWKTDGTPQGTLLVFEDPDRRLTALTYLAGEVFFVLTRDIVDSSDGQDRELWRSNGTPLGTTLVADLGRSLNRPKLVIVNDTLVIGFWGPVLIPGLTSTDVWRIQRFAPQSGHLEPVAETARDALHCPTPTCSCALSRPEQSAVVADKWYAQLSDPQTADPRLVVVRAVYFADVLPDHWAFSWVETLADAGLTGGCGPLAYCPEQAVSRAEIAVFLLRGVHGASYQPPAGTGSVFTDVPAAYWASGWIERLSAEGITGGCGGGLYCPDLSVTRAEIAILLLRAKHGPGYTPPPATGTTFADVPASHWAASWIEQLAREGIAGGCDAQNYCPDAPVTRGAMAVLLARAFDL